MKYFTLSLIVLSLGVFSIHAFAETLTGGGYSLIINNDAPQGSYSGGGYSGLLQTALSSQSYYSSNSSLYVGSGTLSGTALLIYTNSVNNKKSQSSSYGFLNKNNINSNETLGKEANICYQKLIVEYLSSDYSARQSMKRILVSARYLTWLSGRKKVRYGAKILISEDNQKPRKIVAINNCQKYYDYLHNK